MAALRNRVALAKGKTWWVIVELGDVLELRTERRLSFDGRLGIERTETYRPIKLLVAADRDVEFLAEIQEA